MGSIAFITTPVPCNEDASDEAKELAARLDKPNVEQRYDRTVEFVRLKGGKAMWRVVGQRDE